MKKLTTTVLALFMLLLFVGSIYAEQNGVMMQYFHWYTPGGGVLWKEVKEQAKNLSEAGITALWLPPAYKGDGGAYDVGYGVYDIFDLGEFNQKGTIATKYGTKQEYIDAINAAHTYGLNIYADVVFNHKGGADGTETVEAVRVSRDNRNYEYGGNVSIKAWTKFDFPGRGDKYSPMKWRWYHFDGVDWDDNAKEGSIFKFRGQGKAWDWEVDNENQNYDYLMYADLDMDHPEVINELKQWGRWIVNEADVDGFRIDAVKHIRFDFFADWLNDVRTTTGKDLFAVGEFWSYNTAKLHNYIAKSGGVLSLFDAPLHKRFHDASKAGGSFDMRTIMDDTLMKDQPALAVTIVENHDTQPCQALQSPVEDWFKPLAYAFILLREEGYPNIFYADYYGADYKDCASIHMASHKAIIDKLLAARRDYAYGTQYNYMDDPDVIGWTRLGDIDHPSAMAVIMSDSGGNYKWMEVGRSKTIFRDITGNRTETITTNDWGWGRFPVNGGSVSVWVGDDQSNNGETSNGVNFTCYNGYTYWGQSVYVVGNNQALGNWNTNNAIKLNADNYPAWDGVIPISTNTSFEWKCVKIEGSKVEWQSGANNSYGGTGGSTMGSF